MARAALAAVRAAGVEVDARVAAAVDVAARWGAGAASDDDLAAAGAAARVARAMARSTRAWNAARLATDLADVAAADSLARVRLAVLDGAADLFRSAGQGDAAVAHVARLHAAARAPTQ